MDRIPSVNRRQFLQAGGLALGGSVIGATTQAGPLLRRGPTLITAQAKLDKVTFGTNWFAQAEHGGFYQAVATGLYKEAGLDVTVKMGGPQVNGAQLLVGGAIEFFMGSGQPQVSAAAEGIPLITVAAMFQKDPQVLVAHPDQGITKFEDLKGKRIFISSGAKTTFWPFLKAKFGFKDEQIAPYNFNMGPFLQDKASAQQGYLTSEPFSIEKEGGFKPVVFLLADYGYSPYATTIQTTRKQVDGNPDLVQRFVDASIKGWYSYFKDPAPGNVLIKKDNPKMTDDLLKNGVEKMKEYGIIFGGDAEKMGVGAMTDARWKTLFDSMSQSGLVPATAKYQDGYTLKFINKGVDAYQV